MMDTLTAEENLIAQVARATCFAFRFKSGNVPNEDVQLYVNALIALHRRKPIALLLQQESGDEPETVASSLAFCADQLSQVAPDQAKKLRRALELYKG
jgi:hypothetical protein